MTDASAFRLQRIRYAAVTSIASKVVTTAVQLVALPVAIRALGPDNFALYAVLAAALGWVGLASIGVGPPLAVSVADAAARIDEGAQQQLFTSALLPVSGIVVFLALCLFSLLPIAPVGRLFGANFEYQAETVRIGMALLLAIALMQALLSVPEAAQTGYQEQYIFNIWATLGNLVSLVALLMVALLAPSIIAMILAVNLPPIGARLLNSVRFLFHRQFLLPRLKHFRWQHAQFLLSNGAIFSLAGSLGNFLNHQYVVVLVGRTSTTQETSTFAIMINVFLLAFGILSMIAVPLWPALADSQSRGEGRWAKAAYNKVLLYGMAYALIFALSLTLFGDKILRIWFGPTVHPGHALLLLTGVYFIVDVWEYIHFMVLIGLKRIWGPSLVYLARSLCAVIITPRLLNLVGTPGAMVALTMSALLTTGPVLWLLVRRGLSDAQRSLGLD